MSTLVPSERPRDQDVHDLRARVVELEGILAERDAEVARLKVDLAAFKIRYRQDVGLLHDELDDLEAALEEAERALITGGVKSKAAGVEAPPPLAPQPESAPRFTSDAVRRLFRDVARSIHPDLARDDLTREHRHRLMVEANRAYALGDEQRLRSILQAWERRPEAVHGEDMDAVRSRLERRIAQLEEQLEAYAADLAALKDTPIWKLKAMVDEAAANGKDLIADMLRRLQRDILVTRNRLDALRPQAP